MQTAANGMLNTTILYYTHFVYGKTVALLYGMQAADSMVVMMVS